MEYHVHTDNFTGPLDLLLHLIKQKNMDLFDLDVSLICDQYLAYIETMDDKYLEQVSEYLVMAAWLIEMKSRLLLPKDNKLDDEDDYEAEKQKMIHRLIEKNQINNVLETFEEAYDSRQQMLTRTSQMINFIGEEETLPDDLEIYDLIEAMQQILKRIQMNEPLESKITKVEISIDDRCQQITDYFNSHPSLILEFEDLFYERDKYYAIVTFLSVLVLVKKQFLKISQENNFSKIFVRKGETYDS